jgi:hypothetical protein
MTERRFERSNARPQRPAILRPFGSVAVRAELREQQLLPRSLAVVQGRPQTNGDRIDAIHPGLFARTGGNVHWPLWADRADAAAGTRRLVRPQQPRRHVVLRIRAAGNDRAMAAGAVRCGQAGSVGRGAPALLGAQEGAAGCSASRPRGRGHPRLTHRPRGSYRRGHNASNFRSRYAGE